LNDLVTVPAGWNLTQATDLNSHGQIAAMAYTGEKHVALRLTPEPRISISSSQLSSTPLTIRAGTRRRTRLQTSSNLALWTDLRVWDQPAPSETAELPNAGNQFFRLVREDPPSL
jgi:hypothetical protein